MENLFSIIFIGVIGGLINLDTTVFAQVMVSRPIVVAPVTGYLLGSLLGCSQEGLSIGLVIGAFLELLWLNTLPVGACVPPNVCIASTVGVSLCLLIKGEMVVDINILIIIMIIEAFILGFICGRLDILWRDTINKKIARSIISYVNEGKLWGLELFNGICILVHFLLGCALCIFSILILIYPTMALIGCLPEKVIRGLMLANSLLPLFGVSVAINMFFTKKSLSYLIIGFILALICRFPN
ncbi:MAG: PTS sugar transporter subunit IIC [bacterium]|nr:PTS sugar transporter subunit IIC [bacterium]